MIREQSSREFLNISGINHKQTNIEFSVENLLICDDYLMTPHHQKALKCNNKLKNGKLPHKKSKKQLQVLPKSIAHQAEKAKKKSVACKQKPKELPQQKQTQDNSQTRKLSIGKLSPKLNTAKKINKITESPIHFHPKNDSNKFQLNFKTRSRTKSSCSIPSNRKCSQLLTQECSTNNFNSKISISKQTSLPNTPKIRSQTIKDNLEQIRQRHQDMIRNDYFQEGQLMASVSNHNCIKQKNMKKRSISIGKKIEFENGRSKKKLVLKQKLVQKNAKSKN